MSVAENLLRQQAKEYQARVEVTVQMKYLLYLPPTYSQGTERWPLVLFLHGMGESGNDLDLVKVHGPPKLVEQGKEFPFVLVSPQNDGLGWRPHELLALVDQIAADYRIDQDRIYVTGLSMGGYGTWALAMTSPHRFAAIAPVCGGGFHYDAQRLKHLPIWTFHGEKDEVVPLSQTQNMVDRLKKHGADQVKVTVYSGVGHDSWTETYANPELYTWMLAQRRSQSK